MSTAEGLTPAGGAKVVAPVAAAARPRLRVAATPEVSPSRGPFVLLVAGMLGLGLLALLLLNTVLAQDAFVLHDLQGKAAQLRDRQQALERDVEAEAAPNKLAARASALGMVPSENPVFLRLRDGKVLGVPTPAKKPPPPKPKPTPAASPGPAPAASNPAAAAPPTRAATARPAPVQTGAAR